MTAGTMRREMCTPKPCERKIDMIQSHAAFGNRSGLPETPESRLWSDLNTRLDQGRWGDLRVLALGFDQDDIEWLRSCLRTIGVRHICAERTMGRLLDVSDVACPFSLVIVNLDGFQSLGAAVDALLAFRKRVPGVVVIAASSQVADDDLGSERDAICDVTLRLPLTELRLRHGLIAACANNLSSLRTSRGQLP